MVYPWSPGPVTSGRSCSSDARVPCWLRGWGGGAAGRWTGASRAPSRGGGGGGGGIMRAGVRGAACCGLELRRGEVHMMLRVLRVLEFQF